MRVSLCVCVCVRERKVVSSVWFINTKLKDEAIGCDVPVLFPVCAFDNGRE